MMLSKDAVTIRTSVANYPGCTCQITDKYLFGKTVSFSCNYEVLEQWAGDETYKKCRPVVEFSVFDKNGTRLLYRATKGTETPTGSLILSFVLPSYENGMYLHCGFHISNSVNGSVQEEGREVVFSNVQLEVDSQATPYAPYIDNFSGVTIKRYGKNILPYPYRTMGTQKINGITFKVNDDRSVTVSGVATADANFALWNADLGAGMLYNGGTNGEYSVSPMIRYVPSTKNVTVYVPSGTNLSTSVTIYPQIEVGTVTTDYEPYKDPTIHISETDGLVKGVISYYPVTTLVPDAEGIAIDCEYNIDPKRYIDKKFSELQALILEV